MPRQSIQGRVEGLEASRAALERIVRAETAALPGALELIGQQWVTEIQRRAPLQTGRLRRSYTWEVGSEGGKAYVEVSSNVVYAPYQEFGTSRQSGTPHVRPATEAIRPKVRELVVEAAARAGRGASIGGAGGITSIASRLASLARGG